MADLRELVVPELGESITEAIIARWLKEPGDAIEVDEPVVELETDKVTVQLPAPARGVLRDRNASEGETVKVGAVVGTMDASDRGARDEAEARVAVEEVRGHREARVAALDGKSAVKVEELSAGRPEHDAPAQAKPARGEPATRAPAPDAQAVDEEALRRLSPSQRRAARMGAPVAAPPVPGREAPAAAPAVAPAPSRPAATRAPATRAPAPGPDEREEVVPMSPLRKRIAERLVQAQRESASLTTFNEVDMSAVMALRSRHKDVFQREHGVKLGFMSFFAKACVAACRRFPGLNAEIRDDAIVYKKSHDYGVAVSTERGLVVPVLRDVDRMSFADIEKGIMELALKARDGKLTLGELTGGTFTITNGGVFGSMLSTPLLNYPQTGILGMHNIVQRPVAVDGRVEVRPVMYVALTYDHRVVDGREAVQFLVAVKERIEQPETLLLEV